MRGAGKPRCLPDVQPPVTHASLTLHQPYYYVVTSRRGSKESAESAEVVAVLDIDGTDDPGFGTGEVFSYDGGIGGGRDRAWSVTVDTQGRVVVVGGSDAPSGDPDMFVWRLR